jgi:hypothetical protein
MSVNGVSSNASASYLNSPGVRLGQIQASALSTLWDGATGNPSDLNSFTPTAAAMSLYQHPGLMSGLTQWDGGMTPGSQRSAPAAPSPAPTPAPAKPPVFSFNPFDRASWWSDPKGAAVDTKA